MKKFKALLLVILPIIVAIILCILAMEARVKIDDSLGLPWRAIFFMRKRGIKWCRMWLSGEKKFTSMGKNCLRPPKSESGTE